MRVVSIVGARPQFVKLAVVARAFRAFPEVTHEIIHTGQHYDDEMSGSFFRDLQISPPLHNLEVGSGSHAKQTSEMMRLLEPILLHLDPDWVIVYGDTNSTMAATITASKMRSKIAHVEAGLRSFNRAMPEEINRVAADHLSHLLFCPTDAALANLEREGLADRAVLCGDVMYDAVCDCLRELTDVGAADSQFPFPANGYALATIHRAENTDDPERLKSVLAALRQISGEVCPVVLAIHPRTKKVLESLNWDSAGIHVIPPLPYRKMLSREKHARLIVTDSGGVQKEAYFLKVPCITLRSETEWVETLENDCNVLVNASDLEVLRVAVRRAAQAGPWGRHYGHANAGEIIAQAIAAPKPAQHSAQNQGNVVPVA